MAYAGLLFSWLVGLALLPPRLRSGRLPLAFGAGVFAISLQMLGYDLIGLPWNRWSLLLPWLVVIGLRVYRTGARRLLPEVPSLRERWAFLSILVVVPIAAWLPYERLMPLTSASWDAWAIWLFKAKAFYLDSGVGGFLARADELVYHQPGYPLLFPLYGSFLYVLEGGVNVRGPGPPHAGRRRPVCPAARRCSAASRGARPAAPPWLAQGPRPRPSPWPGPTSRGRRARRVRPGSQS